MPVNAYYAFKFLLEFEMNSSAIEETFNKSFQTAFSFEGGGGGGAYYLISLNFSLKISSLAPIF